MKPHSETRLWYINKVILITNVIMYLSLPRHYSEPESRPHLIQVAETEQVTVADVVGVAVVVDMTVTRRTLAAWVEVLSAVGYPRVTERRSVKGCTARSLTFILGSAHVIDDRVDENPFRTLQGVVRSSEIIKYKSYIEKQCYDHEISFSVCHRYV